MKKNSRPDRTQASVLIALAAVLGLSLVGWGIFRHSYQRAPVISDPSCLKAYQDLEQSDELRIVIAFGYKDSRPARFVGDRYEKAVFVQRLLGSCRDAETACEFSRDGRDSELLRRSVRGPDGRRIQVLLRIVQPSAGPDDDENRRDPFQKWKTKHVKSVFEAALADADIVFYNGHSRDGGGPDFGPPKVTSGKHADYGWYRAHRPGMWATIQALKAGKKGKSAESKEPKVLGLFSCVSDRWFTDPLNRIKPDLALITSGKLIYFAEALETSWQALDALLSLKCQPEFERAIGTRTDQAGTTEINGFF